MAYTKKAGRIKRYPAETVTDTQYPDNLVLCANKLVQTNSLLHSIEQQKALTSM